MLRDVRYGARMLLKHKGFTAVAVLTLTLGIGANTAIFSVVNGVLLKSLPFPESERLVTISETSKEVPVLSVAFPNYLDWRAQQTVFEDLAAWRPAGGVITGGQEPLPLAGRSRCSCHVAAPRPPPRSGGQEPLPLARRSRWS